MCFYYKAARACRGFTELVPRVYHTFNHRTIQQLETAGTADWRWNEWWQWTWSSKSWGSNLTPARFTSSPAQFTFSPAQLEAYVQEGNKWLFGRHLDFWRYMVGLVHIITWQEILFQNIIDLTINSFIRILFPRKFTYLCHFLLLDCFFGLHIRAFHLLF